MRFIFITGVSRGLGQSLSKAFAGGESKLIGFGRTQGEFEGEFHSCDFTKPELAASIFESALASAELSEASSLSFISNAGRLGLLSPAQDHEVFDIEQTIAANLVGTAIAARAFIRQTQDLPLPKCFAQISSGAALPDRAKACWSLYCASKAGQEQYVRSIAKEQERAAHPISCININPGVMETAMQEQIRDTPASQFPEVERFIAMKNEGRIPHPDTIAEKIAELLSDLTALKNGHTYNFTSY